MENTIAVVELGSKKLKLVIGYELDGKPYVIHASTKKYGPCIEAGNFRDLDKVVKALNEIKSFADENVKLHFDIYDAVVVLPPYGLQIFQTSQTTTVMDNEQRVAVIDLKNVLSLIKNSSLPGGNNNLIDIIPDVFVLNDGRKFEKAPLGEKSSLLKVQAKVHALPNHIVTSYRNAFLNAKLRVRHSVVSSFAATEYLATLPNIPDNFFLVDIGSNATTVSLIGKKKLFGSRFFEWGGDSITNAISESFQLSFEESERLKITYGLDTRNYGFTTMLANVDSENPSVTTEELNEVIKKELETFVKQLELNLDSLLANYTNADYKKWPMVIIGGGSKLNGLVSYLEPKLQCESVQTVSSKTLGGRDLTYVNCIGALLTTSKYHNPGDDNSSNTGLEIDKK